MEWSEIRAEYEPLVSAIKNFPVPEWLRTEIAQALINEFEQRIKGGQVTPPLTAATIAAKQKRGAANPSAPLYDTGEMSESLGIETNTYKQLLISAMNAPKVSPNWHMDPEHLARNNPLREVLTDAEVLAIIDEKITNWLNMLSIEDVIALGQEVR